ncbi:MAG: PI-PLC X domain-containing protein 2 [Geoglossum umbratile]|nr:MAG: PI-PLC X domain-containing protein 2 [Geoglossum umbratile]
MAPLDIEWKNNPDSGSNIVTTFVNPNGVFVGTNGSVFRVDYWTGSTLYSNNLQGTGYHEIRFAAPLDASILVAGTNGYVACLNPNTLATIWSVSLPGTGFNITEVFCAAGSVYAGCNGYVFRLDPSNGSVLATNTMSGYGNHEVRLGMTLALSTLLVGINGYAVAMDINSLDIKWYNNMSGSGHDVTSVLGGDGVGYAACGGRVYRIDEGSGNTLNENDLSGTGSNEVRMAMDADATHLYVGTNGYANGLRPDTLDTKYSISLPGSGYTVTSVAAGLDTAYYANNGYVFQIDSGGHVVASNPLSGYGKDETRLSVDSNATGQLFVGLNGYAFGLALGDYPPSYGPWMGQMASQLGPKMLRQVALPGTHDSGTYGINLFSPVADDDLQWLQWIEVNITLATLVKALMKSWSISQPLDFAHQLAAGIRYFDLRVQAFKDDAGHISHKFVHGLVSVSADELFNHVNTFLSQSGNDKEVILLDFNHFYDFDDVAHVNLAASILFQFRDKLAPSNLGADVTLSTLWGTNNRIVTFYADAATASKNYFLWSSTTISSPWPNKQTANDVLAYLDGLMPYAESTFFVLQGVITPDSDLIQQGLTPFTDNPNGLFELAETINSPLVDRLKSWKGKGVNVVIADFFNWSPAYVDAVVKLNS